MQALTVDLKDTFNILSSKTIPQITQHKELTGGVPIRVSGSVGLRRLQLLEQVELRYQLHRKQGIPKSIADLKQMGEWLLDEATFVRNLCEETLRVDDDVFAIWMGRCQHLEARRSQATD